MCKSTAHSPFVYKSICHNGTSPPLVPFYPSRFPRRPLLYMFLSDTPVRVPGGRPQQQTLLHNLLAGLQAAVPAVFDPCADNGA